MTGAEQAAEYKDIMGKHPNTVTALAMPLYIARHYSDHDMLIESEVAYESAIKEYDTLINKDPHGKQVPILQYLIITAYANRGNWKKAVEALEFMARKYHNSENAALALYRAALINRDVLKNYDKSLAEFQIILDGYQGDALIKNLKIDMAYLFMLRGELKRAESEYASILKQYKYDNSVCAHAILSMGMGFEDIGSWDDASKEYRIIQREYPDTLEAILAPILIAQHYLNENKITDSQKILLEVSNEPLNRLYVKQVQGEDRYGYEQQSAENILREDWYEWLNSFPIMILASPDGSTKLSGLLNIHSTYKQLFKNVIKINTNSGYSKTLVRT